MVAALLAFVLASIGAFFLIGQILAIYEGFKPGGDANFAKTASHRFRFTMVAAGIAGLVAAVVCFR